VNVRHGAAGRCQPARRPPAARPQPAVQAHVLDSEQGLELLHRAHADQRRGDAGLLLDPQDGQLRRREAGLLGKRREMPADLDTARGYPVGIEAAA
jgi:hypothetical protein